MNQAQKDLRRAAARAFMESLDALAQRLSDEPETALHPAPGSAAPAPSSQTPPAGKTFVKELEEAVADIEQYRQH